MQKPKTSQPSEYLQQLLEDPAFILYCREIASTKEFQFLLEAITMKVKSRHPLNSSLPEHIFRHNQAVREAVELYRQTAIDIIFSEERKTKRTSETEMED